ncbi:MAG TPA: hypothetical protein DCP02_05825, partial [Actinobacteria bacterium]|nr:hypothetical protein [Actinomycetota bacterium]
MKKVLIITMVIALAIMLAFPAILFAEEGDANSTVGVRDTDGNYDGFSVGQYILGDEDADTPQPSDDLGDNTPAEKTNGDADDDLDGERDGAGAIDGDGDTEVFCIDGDTTWNPGADQYTLTDIDVSDELVGEVTGADTITEVEAEAVEILATEATGATSAEDQVAVWQETGDLNDTAWNNSHPNVGTINTAVEALAIDFINNGDGRTLDKFLNDENVNEIDVTVEQDSAIFDEVTPIPGTATAIMENPLVPTITDEGKNVYWYILGGAFNISFSPDYLLMETNFDSAAVDGTDATLMTDKVDDIGGEDVDNDGKDEADDHYGLATVSYYYYNWGLDTHPEGTMGINLYAWVDVDEDGLF